MNLLIKNSLWLSAAPFLPKLMGIMLLPIMTKHLSETDFGIAGTISAYINIIGAFNFLGLGIVLQNSFFNYPNRFKFVWSQVAGILRIWMIIYSLGQAFLLSAIIPDIAVGNRNIIIFLTILPNVLFGPITLIGESYLIYSKKSFQLVWRSVLSGFITVAITFICIVYFEIGYLGWYFGTCAGSIFLCFSYINIIFYDLSIKSIYKFRRRSIKKYFNISLPAIPHYYSIYLQEGSGRMLLDQNGVSKMEIGRISMVQQFGDMFLMGISGLNNAFSPFLLQCIKEDSQDKMRKLSLILIIFIFGLAFLFSLWSKEVLDFFISIDSMKSAYYIFIVYIMGICYRPLYYIISLYYFFYERTPQLLYLSFISGLLGLILYYFFIPRIGIWAIPVGYYLSSLYFGYFGFLYRTYRENVSKKLPFLKLLFIQVLLTILALLFVNNFKVKVVLSVLTFVIVVYALNKFKHAVL